MGSGPKLVPDPAQARHRLNHGQIQSRATEAELQVREHLRDADDFVFLISSDKPHAQANSHLDLVFDGHP